MWTNPHISKQLLDIHINPDIDLGSRKKNAIERTVEWILSNCSKEKMNILDLGCGPGLYSEILAEKGHSVTGVDISKTSIEYADQEAEKKNLDIKYFNQSYLDLDFENQFDLAILIYTDFGVLNPGERKTILNNVRKALKPEGKFIFDFLNLLCKAHIKTWYKGKRPAC